MNISEFLTTTLSSWAEFLPLPWFAFIGAFVEELTPIPASLIMTILGSLSAVKENNFFVISALLLIAAIGKEIGYFLIYFIGDKGENLILKKFGRFFGVKHGQIEAIGKHLNKGWRDDLIIFLFRALPIMPTMPVSLVCGVIKVNFRTYMVSSFVGTLVRNALYMWLGFSGVEILDSISNNKMNEISNWLWVVLSIIIIGAILLFIYKDKIKSRFKL